MSTTPRFARAIFKNILSKPIAQMNIVVEEKHMMDHFKDPSAMSHLDFLKDLGPGLIAVGVDKTLKAAGKDSGLLYGPGPKVVASMVNNERCKVGYLESQRPDRA